MRDLAASLGLQLTDLLAEGELSMGDLPPSQSGVFASYRWDIHHEAAGELGRRSSGRAS